MANARALAKRRKSIRNIKKITRTMELIATARFKKAMDRAVSSTAFAKRITQVVRDLAGAGLDVSHPLLQPREKPQQGRLLVRRPIDFCGGYNGNILRLAASDTSRCGVGSTYFDLGKRASALNSRHRRP
jgi:F-type H+-transporting ATPase subunit gamma